MEAEVLLPTDKTRAWVRDWWLAAGSAAEEAQRVADHLVAANLAGHDSHGIGMVGPYVRSLLADELQLNQRIAVITDTDTLLVVDGNRGMGQTIAYQTMRARHRAGAATRRRDLSDCGIRIISAASVTGRSRRSPPAWPRSILRTS